MATLPLSVTTGVAIFRFPGLLGRTLLTWCEELNRALAATHRYEDLRIRQTTEPPLRDRGAKARQVFLDVYADA